VKYLFIIQIEPAINIVQNIGEKMIVKSGIGFFNFPSILNFLAFGQATKSGYIIWLNAIKPNSKPKITITIHILILFKVTGLPCLIKDLARNCF
jgi:hypothetical protein